MPKYRGCRDCCTINSNCVLWMLWSDKKKQAQNENVIPSFRYWYVLCSISVYMQPFPPPFGDIQLIVTVLFHRSNSHTDSGEAKVEREQFVLGNTTSPSCTASWFDLEASRINVSNETLHTRRPCQRACTRPTTGAARARWHKDITAGQTLP